MNRSRQPQSIRRFKLAAQNSSSEELLLRAQQDLRYVPWTNLSEGMMTSNVSEVINPSLGIDCLREQCGTRRIDYFLSHSWHDDPQAKWQVLSKEAQDLARRRSRVASFWIDKFCIDQDSIADGLRALPVNLMACSRVLVLWGPTYPLRIWCAWELFTVLAFTSMEVARERLVFRALGGDISSALEGFDVAVASCYDPNEQRRLMGIITALGQERFNRRLRSLSHVSSAPMGTRSSLLSRFARGCDPPAASARKAVVLVEEIVIGGEMDVVEGSEDACQGSSSFVHIVAV